MNKQPFGVKIRSYFLGSVVMTTLIIFGSFSYSTPGMAELSKASNNKADQTSVSKMPVAAQNEKKKPELDKEKMASRGKMLYMNHCHACHESNVHIRAHRKVKKKADIEYWVKRWSTYLKLNWKDSDRQQVIEYLNQAYYRY